MEKPAATRKDEDVALRGRGCMKWALFSTTRKVAENINGASGLQGPA